MVGTTATGDLSMKDLRATLTPNHRKIVSEVMGQLERELIAALPELQAGVNTAAASGSFSATLQISKARKRFKGKLSARVRTPREPYELDFHLDDGQLTLGLGPDAEEDEDAEEEVEA